MGVVYRRWCGKSRGKERFIYFPSPQLSVVQFRAFVGRVDPEDAVHPEGAERTRRVVVVEDVRQVVAHGIVLADLRDLVGGSVSLEDGGVAGAEPFDPLTISLAEGDHDPPAVQERHQLFAAVGVSGRVGEREGDADV